MNYASPADKLRERLYASNLADDVLVDAVHPQERTIPLSYSQHVRGWHPVRPDHPPVAFESKLESRFISMVLRFPDLAYIQSQPITVWFQVDAAPRRYTPDFLVVFSAVPKALARLGFGRESYVEVKPLLRAVSMEAKLAQKFQVLRAATGRPVVLITDWDLESSVREARHAG